MLTFCLNPSVFPIKFDPSVTIWELSMFVKFLDSVRFIFLGVDTLGIVVNGYAKPPEKLNLRLRFGG